MIPALHRPAPFCLSNPRITPAVSMLPNTLIPLSPAGGMVGQRLSDHPDIRKLGFTGSTPIGKQIMKRYERAGLLLVD